MLHLLLAMAATDLPKPTPDQAQVVFFRSGTLMGGAISCAVHENGTKLTSLPPGRYAAMMVKPGPHDFVVASEAKDTWKIEAQPGQTYFAKCTVGMGVMAGHPHLNSSSEAEFDRMAGKLKPAKQLEMVEGVAPAAP